MSTTPITVTPAPSRGGLIMRDPFTRAEIFVDVKEIQPLIRRLERDRDNLVAERRGA